MVTPLKIGFVEWPESLSVEDAEWSELKDSVTAARPDILVTNELPFGPWIAEGTVFSEDTAHLSLRAHENGLKGLINLNLSAIIASRPVRDGKRLANEAFVLENGVVRSLHRKQYFPNEPGWFESEWYSGDCSGFDMAEVLGLKVGVLLCTEAMFNERAPAYGRQGTSLIVIPRASGVNIESWKIAGAMASLVSGAYVVSSNRSGRSRGVLGLAASVSPMHRKDGCWVVTISTDPLQMVDLDPKIATSAQRAYPCYVPELE